AWTGWTTSCAAPGTCPTEGRASAYGRERHAGHPDETHRPPRAGPRARLRRHAGPRLPGLDRPRGAEEAVRAQAVHDARGRARREARRRVDDRPARARRPGVAAPPRR